MRGDVSNTQDTLLLFLEGPFVESPMVSTSSISTSRAIGLAPLWADRTLTGCAADELVSITNRPLEVGRTSKEPPALYGARITQANNQTLESNRSKSQTDSFFGGIFFLGNQ